MIGAAALDQTHCSKRTAVEITANYRTMLVDGAALLAEVDAGAIRTLRSGSSVAKCISPLSFQSHRQAKSTILA